MVVDLAATRALAAIMVVAVLAVGLAALPFGDR
jgi:hypothetical protein